MSLIIMQKIGMISMPNGGKLLPATLLQTSDIQIKSICDKNSIATIGFFKKPIFSEYNFNNSDWFNNIRNLENICVSDMGINEKDYVKVIGYSKGKGFCGVIKKYGFSRLKESHGTSATHRSRGSCGSRNPNHVRKNTKMAGRHGNRRTTVSNLEILKIIKDKNIILIKGSVPGCNGSLLFVTK